MTKQPESARAFGTSRRQVLTGAGAVALCGGIVALAGCGEGGQPAKTPTPAGPPVEVPSSQVPVGNGLILKDKYVVTQPEAGQFHAFSKTCPHAGCAVSFIKNKQIVCACHGSEFSITDGARTAGPARSGLSPVAVRQDGDNLVVGG